MCPYVSPCVPLCPSINSTLCLVNGCWVAPGKTTQPSIYFQNTLQPPMCTTCTYTYTVLSAALTVADCSMDAPRRNRQQSVKNASAPKKLSKSRQSGLPCENLEHQKINDTNHDFFLHINGEGLIHQVAPQMIENIMKSSGKSMKAILEQK